MAFPHDFRRGLILKLGGSLRDAGCMIYGSFPLIPRHLRARRRCRPAERSQIAIKEDGDHVRNSGPVDKALASRGPRQDEPRCRLRQTCSTPFARPSLSLCRLWPSGEPRLCGSCRRLGHRRGGPARISDVGSSTKRSFDTRVWRPREAEADQDVLPKREFRRSDCCDRFLKHRDMHSLMRLALHVDAHSLRSGQSRDYEVGDVDTAR